MPEKDEHSQQQGYSRVQPNTHRDCLHLQPQLEAYIGRLGAVGAIRGLPWEALAPEQRDLDGIRAVTALGACGCGVRVVSIRAWGHGTNAPTWSIPWTPLALDRHGPAGMSSPATHPHDLGPGTDSQRATLSSEDFFASRQIAGPHPSRPCRFCGEPVSGPGADIGSGPEHPECASEHGAPVPPAPPGDASPVVALPGPYQTEAQARAEAMPRAVVALHAVNRMGGEAVLHHLLAACSAAGVDLGDYDSKILRWLAEMWETETVQVIIGLIARSHAAGRAHAATADIPEDGVR
ncbi:hypothetical protein [Frankia sp. Cr1]|uniref:hypothetical protein n=1 Tax=Frankia sp. Cr1 TaxID=3073931 RepID=UPI002AD41FE5|nr:hypothetical protein [Frankia sp. Cr1]